MLCYSLVCRYHRSQPNGTLRCIEIRRGSSLSGSPEYMVIIVTTQFVTSSQLQCLASAAREAGGPAVVSVVHSIVLAGEHIRQVAVRVRDQKGLTHCKTIPVKLRPRHVSRAHHRSTVMLHPQSSEALFGRSTLDVTLCGLRFEASPHAFLQTNINQTEVLYQMIAEAAGA